MFNVVRYRDQEGVHYKAQIASGYEVEVTPKGNGIVAVAETYPAGYVTYNPSIPCDDPRLLAAKYVMQAIAIAIA